ncbi:MAG: xanthine dehydrogenase family protein molybdopterin-binding subunit [Acidimicrobiales bacterium]
MPNSPRRKEDPRLLRGRGRFVSDLSLPGMRHAAFVRSEWAHGVLLGVGPAGPPAVDASADPKPDANPDADPAAEIDVFTATSPGFDLGLVARSALPGYIETTQPVLARDRVRFAGEPIALVVAADRYLAEDAAETIVVDVDPLPVTVRAWVAPTGGPTPLHAGAPDNVLLQRRFQAGDVDTALNDSAVVIRRTLITNRHGGNPLEGRATVVLWEDEARLTLWSGTQVPHLVRNLLAELLGLPESHVRVIAPDVGGGFGVKAVLYPEDVALCLAARTMVGTPIKWVEDRSEHLRAATHARDHRYRCTAGFDGDGKLLAIRAEVDCNVGAYSVYPWTAGIEPLMAGGLLPGPYKLANYDCTVRGVATNTAPSGPYRGVARPATVFVMESLLDSGAAALGMDPVDIRRINLIGPADVPYRMATNLVDDTGHYAECLEAVLETLDLPAIRAEQRRRAQDPTAAPLGVGFAVYNELTGLGRAASAGPRMPFRTGHEAATVRINPDGRLTVLAGVTSQGQGLETTLAQVVADAVGVPYEHVDVRFGDTNESLWGFGAFSSRQAVIGGGAAHQAALAVRDQLRRLAAELHEANPDDVEVREASLYVTGSPEPLASVAELARIAYLETNRLPQGIDPGLEATRFYDPVMGAFAAGAQAAVIEIDPHTAELRVLRWVCVEDPGHIINHQIVTGQVAGSIAQGIGGALLEHLVYDDIGNLQTTTLLDYLMPTAGDIPDLELGHVCHRADNPTGVRGVGEGGTLGPAAVLAGAVRDALGIEIDQLPITPERLWHALATRPNPQESP